MFKNTKIRWFSAALTATLPVATAGVLQAPARAADGGAAPAAVAHHAYVAMVTNKGAFDADEATIMATVDAGLQRWESEAAGRLTFDRIGPLKKFETTKECTSANRGALRTEAAALFPGVSFGGASHNDLIVVQPSCFGSSSGVNGSSIDDASGRLSLAFAANKGTQSLIHELGHTFGLGHANAVRCAETCVPTEYKNHYSPMGTTITRTPEPWVPASFDSYELSMLGVDAGVQSVTLPAGRRTSTTTVDIRGRGTDAGVRGVKVVDPVDGSTYFLDFRNGVGRDAGAWYPTSRASDEFFYNKGVTVEKVVTTDGEEGALLQSFPQADGTGYRYAKTADEVFEAGNVRVEVGQMQLTGAEADTATIRVTLTNPSVRVPVTPLSQNVSGAQGSQSYFTVDVPAGATDLKIRISGGSGDADLYTRFGEAPTKTSYDCRPYVDGNDELCSVAAPAAGKWHVMLAGYRSYANVTLSATYTN